MKYQCEYCDAETDYASVLLDCEARCAAEDRITRGWSKRYDFHRKD